MADDSEKLIFEIEAKGADTTKANFDDVSDAIKQMKEEAKAAAGAAKDQARANEIVNKTLIADAIRTYKEENKKLAEAQRESARAAKEQAQANLIVAKALQTDEARRLKEETKELAKAQREAAKASEDQSRKHRELLSAIGSRSLELPGIKSVRADMENFGNILSGIIFRLADFKTGLYSVVGIIGITGAAVFALTSALALANTAVTGMSVAVAGLGVLALAQEEFKGVNNQVKELQKYLDQARPKVDQFAGQSVAQLEQKLSDLQYQQSRTFLGMIQTIGAWVKDATKFLATPLFDPLKAQLRGVIDLINSPLIQNALASLQARVAAFAQNELPKLIAGFKSFATGLIDALPTIKTYTDTLRGIADFGFTPIRLGIQLAIDAFKKFDIASASSQSGIGFLKNVTEVFGKTITIVTSAIAGFAIGLIKGIAPAVSEITKNFNSATGSGEGFKNLLQAVGTIAGQIGEGLGKVLGAGALFGAKLLEIAANAGFFNDKLNILNTIFNTIRDVFNIFTKALTDNQPLIQTAVTTISNLLSNAFTFVGNIVTQVAQFIADHMDTIARVINNVGQIATEIFNFLAGLIESNMPLFKGIWETLFSIADVVSAILVPAIKVLTEWWGFLTTAITFLVKTALSPVIAGINLLIKGINLLIDGYNLLAPAIGQKTIPKLKELNLELDDNTKKTTTASKEVQGLHESFNKAATEIATGKLSSAGKKEIEGILEALKSNDPKIRAEATALANGLVTSYTNNAKNATPETKKIMVDVQQAIRDAQTPAKTEGGLVGRALAQGIGQGFQAEFPALVDLGQRAVDAVLAAARKQGLIKSPSRAMADLVGKPLMQGLIEGAKSQYNALQEQGRNSVKAFVTSANLEAKASVIAMPSMDKRSARERAATGPQSANEIGAYDAARNLGDRFAKWSQALKDEYTKVLFNMWYISGVIDEKFAESIARMNVSRNAELKRNDGQTFRTGGSYGMASGLITNPQAAPVDESSIPRAGFGGYRPPPTPSQIAGYGVASNTTNTTTSFNFNYPQGFEPPANPANAAIHAKILAGGM